MHLAGCGPELDGALVRLTRINGKGPDCSSSAPLGQLPAERMIVRSK
jgi:hypothetical protein